MAVSEKQIAELEQYFSTTGLPKEVQLDAGAKVIDVDKFVKSHLAVLHNNGTKPAYRSFYQRLLLLKEKLAD